MYELITAYNDCTSKQEKADLASVMRALAIYVEEPDFAFASITNLETGEVLGHWKMESYGLTTG
jgi:hypothetical protein